MPLDSLRFQFGRVSGKYTCGFQDFFGEGEHDRAVHGEECLCSFEVFFGCGFDGGAPPQKIKKPAALLCSRLLAVKKCAGCRGIIPLPGVGRAHIPCASAFKKAQRAPKVQDLRL